MCLLEFRVQWLDDSDVVTAINSDTHAWNDISNEIGEKNLAVSRKNSHRNKQLVCASQTCMANAAWFDNIVDGLKDLRITLAKLAIGSKESLTISALSLFLLGDFILQQELCQQQESTKLFPSVRIGQQAICRQKKKCDMQF